MNVRKSIDYSTMFSALDRLMTTELSQMKLYCAIGQLISGRPEKGAAVAASEYLRNRYPDLSGFSPRNLRRMRKFYSTYKNAPAFLSEAMKISWTQNVVILEADLTLQEKAWYIQAVQKFNWSKLVLAEKIKSGVHTKVYCTEENHASNGNHGEKGMAEELVQHYDCCHHNQGNWSSNVPAKERRLQLFRPPGWEHVSFADKTIKASIACGRQLTLCYTNMITRSERK